MSKVSLILQEQFYNFTNFLLSPLKGKIKKDSLGEKLFVKAEKISKGFLYDCQMCGQCILHSTGMFCSMNCPKTLRNGPCGGVRLNGHCEVKPEMKCVWVQIYENSSQLPSYGQEIMWIQPPLNQGLKNTSAWVNLLNGLDKNTAIEWQSPAEKKSLEENWSKQN